MNIEDKNKIIKISPFVILINEYFQTFEEALENNLTKKIRLERDNIYNKKEFYLNIFSGKREENL